MAGVKQLALWRRVPSSVAVLGGGGVAGWLKWLDGTEAGRGGSTRGTCAPQHLAKELVLLVGLKVTQLESGPGDLPLLLTWLPP